MRKFQKRPIVIEAVRLDADTTCPKHGLSAHTTAHAMIAGWMLGNGFDGFRVVGEQAPFGLEIQTLEGKMTAAPGDWIIRGVHGEFYPCKPDIFEATYEEVDSDASVVPEA